jgi:hypothetical protein
MSHVVLLTPNDARSPTSAYAFVPRLWTSIVVSVRDVGRVATSQVVVGRVS